MTNIIELHDTQQGSQEWLNIRYGKFTGSNALKLLQYGAVDSAKAQPSSFRGNYYTERGHILEDQARKIYETVYKVKLQTTGYVTNSGYLNCLFSPDAFTDKKIIEIKAFNSTKHLSIGKDNIPSEIIAQVQFGMLIMNLKEADLVLYNPDLDPEDAFKVINIKRDKAIQDNFKAKLKAAEPEKPKSKSKILRNVLYLLHRQKGGTDDSFNAYYEAVMDKIIDQFKSKLDDSPPPEPPETQVSEPHITNENPEIYVPDSPDVGKKSVMSRDRDELLSEIDIILTFLELSKNDEVNLYVRIIDKRNLDEATDDELRAIYVVLNKKAEEKTNKLAEAEDKKIDLGEVKKVWPKAEMVT